MDQHAKRETEQRVKIDDVTYIINLANASPALEVVMSLGTLLEDLTVATDKEGDVKEVPIGKILARLNSPEFRELRTFLISYVNVSIEGQKPFRFSERYDAHLDAYPSHYMALLWKSFAFQFARFFRGGAGASSLLPPALRAMLSNAGKPATAPADSTA